VSTVLAVPPPSVAIGFYTNHTDRTGWRGWSKADRTSLWSIVMPYLTYHGSLSAVMHAPFHASMLRPASQAGPMHESAGVGQLSFNAALLSLMRRVWVYAALPSSQVNSSAPLVCRHNRITRETGRVCLMGRDLGGGDIDDVLPVYLYCPAFSVHVSVGKECMPATKHTSTVSPGWT